MKISKYVGSLNPRIEKSKIQDDLQALRIELGDKTLIPISNTVDVLKTWTFKDKFTKGLNDYLPRQMKARPRGNFVEIVTLVLKKTESHLVEMDKIVDKRYAKDIIPSSMTYSDAQLLQLIEAVSFVCNYSRKLMIYTLDIETQLVMDSHAKPKMAPAMIKWLESRRDVYVSCLDALNTEPKDLARLITSIPDVTVDVETEDAVTASTGARKLDPFALGIFGVVLNPIYHLRIAWTDWQIARHDAAKEEKRMLEYQLMDLKNAMEKKADPKIQRALEYTQDRVDKLNYRIRKMEEEVS